MSLNSVDILGNELGLFKKRQTDTQRELAPNDSLGIVRYEEKEVGTILVSGEIKAYKWEYKDDSFIIDHPIQGEIDSAVYKIDGGYTDESPTLMETKSL